MGLKKVSNSPSAELWLLTKQKPPAYSLTRRSGLTGYFLGLVAPDISVLNLAPKETKGVRVFFCFGVTAPFVRRVCSLVVVVYILFLVNINCVAI